MKIPRALLALGALRTAQALLKLARWSSTIPLYENTTYKVVTGPWCYDPDRHRLIILAEDSPRWVLRWSVCDLGSVTLISDPGGDPLEPHPPTMILLLNSAQSPWVLYGRDEDGYLL